MRRLLPALLGLVVTLAHGHEVREQVRPTTATLVQLSYADDAPFSFERYELFVEGGEQPTYTGRTDAQGRIVFLPDGQARWRLRSFSSDGHGVDLHLEVQSGRLAATVAAPDSARPQRFALGLAVIAALYGVLRWRMRRRRAG